MVKDVESVCLQLQCDSLVDSDVLVNAKVNVVTWIAAKRVAANTNKRITTTDHLNCKIVVNYPMRTSA